MRDQTKATGYLNSAETVNAIQTLADLYREGAITGWNSGDIPMTDGFGTGRYTQRSWMVRGKSLKWKAHIQILNTPTAPMPEGEGGSHSVLGGENISMFNTANKDAAWKFMKFMHW
ncbi:MAG: hypothetical protein ACLTUL_02300 [Blautia faecis]